MQPYVMDEEINRTLELYRASPPPEIGFLTPEAQKAWTVAGGFQAYNLLPTALVLTPLITPIRNITPRSQGFGKAAEYKAITQYNSTGVQGYVAEGSAASTVTTVTEDITNNYASFGLGDNVTFEAQWSGRKFWDNKGQAIVGLLRAVMAAEENALLFGQTNGSAAASQFAPGAVGAAPTPTVGTPTGSDGSITAGTYYIKETVVTGMGESSPSAYATVSVGSTNHFTITPVFPGTQPVIGFKFYWCSTTNGTYSEIKAADLTGAVALSNGVLPGGSLAWYTNGETITVLKLTAGNAATPASDGSASSLAFNGIYTQMWGSGASTFTNVNGALTTTVLATHFKAMWNSQWKADPDVMYVHAQESVKITNLTIGGGTPYFVMVGEQNSATANFRVARLTNPVTGTELPVRVHPTCPQGTMLTLSTKLPGWYVPTEIPAVWDFNACQDYVEIDYPPTSASPKWAVEVRLYGAVRLFIPGLCGSLYNIDNT